MREKSIGLILGVGLEGKRTGFGLDLEKKLLVLIFTVGIFFSVLVLKVNVLVLALRQKSSPRH